MVIKRKNIKGRYFGSFDIFVALIFIVSIILLCLFLKTSILLSIGLFITAIWSLFIIAGRLCAPFYIDGHVIRSLIFNNGTMHLNQIQNLYSFLDKSHFEMIMNGLKERDIIEIEKDVIELKNENYKKGLRNRFTMWCVRKGQ